MVYLGGSLFLHLSLRRAMRLIPPGQASIVGAEVGKDFTVMSWLSLAAWGATGYWMLFRYGWGDGGAALTLFIDPAMLELNRGRGLLVMTASWYLLVVSAAVITFVLRPRLTTRLPPDADSARVERVSERLVGAAGWIDRLAIVNLLLAVTGFLAGVLYR